MWEGLVVVLVTAMEEREKVKVWGRMVLMGVVVMVATVEEREERVITGREIGG